METAASSRLHKHAASNMDREPTAAVGSLAIGIRSISKSSPSSMMDLTIRSTATQGGLYTVASSSLLALAGGGHCFVHRANTPAAQWHAQVCRALSTVSQSDMTGLSCVASQATYVSSVSVLYIRTLQLQHCCAPVMRNPLVPLCRRQGSGLFSSRMPRVMRYSGERQVT